MGENIYAYPQAKEAEQSFVVRTFGWMFFALGVTAFVALAVSEESAWWLVKNNVFYILLLAQLGLVIGLSWAIGRISAPTAILLFLVYSGMNGLTLSVIFLAYTPASIYQTFFITAGTFGAMCLYGYVTKRDLTTIGNLAFMALIGIILASIVNIFIGNEALYWIISYLGVAIFVALTAYDTQKIKRMSRAGLTGEIAQKAAIMGALALYLDFIMLFIYLLRIFGRRR